MSLKHAILAIVIVLSGCHSSLKEIDLNPQKPEAIRTFVTKPDAENPGNPNNPYDSAGALHNLILKAIHRHIFQSGDSSNDGIRKFIAGYFKKNRGTNVRKSLNSVPDSLPGQLINDYRKVIFSKKWNPETAFYLQTIFDTISNSGHDTFAILKSKIVTIEKQILQEKQLSFPEKRMLFYTTSIARYSAFYWDHVLNRQSGVARKGKGFLHALKRAVAFVCTCVGDASGVAFAYGSGQYDDAIADADFLSTLTWGGLTYYNNW